MIAPQRVAAIVYNPIKVDLAALEAAVAATAAASGWAPAVWFATTRDDSGLSATAAAVAAGVQLVIAAGGDGTVRAVAEGVRGTGVAMGLLPSGTGNLLARNLDITFADLPRALDVAFNGENRRIDVGLAAIVREGGAKEEHVFLVMAGLGLDAKMIAHTSQKLKKAVGWLAYVDGGIRALPEVRPVRVKYSIDRTPSRTTNVHTIMIGNCGRLPGGILLIPDALPDDGLLDFVALQPKGPFGWLKVWNTLTWENGVLRKSALGRRIIDLTRDVKDVVYLQGKDLRMTVETPQQFQLDGDDFGEAKSVHARIDAHALTVRVPRGSF
jgi:diacylglycerol kinase (ATP)